MKTCYQLVAEITSSLYSNIIYKIKPTPCNLEKQTGLGLEAAAPRAVAFARAVTFDPFPFARAITLPLATFAALSHSPSLILGEFQNHEPRGFTVGDFERESG